MNISEIKSHEIVKGLKGRFVHMESFTIAFWEAEAGAEVRMHSHIHEQTTQVIEGKFQMTCGNETKIYDPGMIVRIAPNVEHGGIAITDCKLTDVFCPVREDYKL